MKKKILLASCLLLFAGAFLWIGCNNGIDLPSLNPPGVPTNVQVSGRQGAALVTWDLYPRSNAGITAFEVSWRIGTGVTSSIEFPPAAGANINSYEVEGLTIGVTYSFRVRAANADGWGPFSEWVDAVSVDEEPLPPLVTLDARSRAIEVTWKTEGAARVIDFEVTWAENGAFSPLLGTEIIAAGEGNQFLITSLTNDKEYFVRMRARNTIGFSEYSETKSATPKGWTAPPEAPANITFDITHTPHGELRLQWTAAARADGYNVKFSKEDFEAAAQWFPAENEEVPFANVIITGLDGGEEYFVWVRAVNELGTSAWVPAGSRKTPNRPAPQEFEMVTAGLGSLRLNWNREAGVIDNQVLFGTSEDIQAATPWTSSISQSGTVISGLNNATVYNVWVRALNQAGWGDWNMKTLATEIQVPFVRFIRNIERGLTLEWPAVDNATSYTLYYGFSNEQDKAVAVPSVTSPFTLTNLELEVYFIWVIADTPVGLSDRRIVMTIPPIVLDAPVLSLGENPAPGTISIQWEANPSATGYDVRYGITSEVKTSDDAKIWAQNITSTGAVIGGFLLEDETEYTAWVRFLDGELPGKWSQINQTTALPKFASPVVFVSASANNQLLVEWEDVPDAFAYEVFSQAVGATSAITQFVGNVNSRFVGTPDAGKFPQVTMAYIPNLINNIPYNVMVRAQDKDGNWGKHTVVSAKINNSAMADRPVIGIDARTLGALRIRWRAVENAVEYEFRYNTGLKPNLKESIAVTNTAALAARDVTLSELGYSELLHFFIRAKLPDDSWTEWGYRKGYTQYEPVGVQDSIWPEYVPDIAAMEALTNKYTVIRGNHPAMPTNPFPTVWGSTAFTNAYEGRSRPVRHTAWISHNPLSYLGYRVGAPREEILDLPENAAIKDLLLANVGKPWFDNLILFNAGLRDRDCLNDVPSKQATSNSQAGILDANVNGKPDNHNCNRQGLHLHLPNWTEYILTNRDKYIQPLQTAGIRVLLSILGDWGGVAFGTFGDWPFEDVSPIAGPGHPGILSGRDGQHPPAERFTDHLGRPFYPYNNAARDAFVMDCRNIVNKYRLDGMDIDDEWWNRIGLREYESLQASGGSTWLYDTPPIVYNYYGVPVNTPWNTSKSGTMTAFHANARRAKNMAEFVIALSEALGPNKVLHLYEYGDTRALSSIMLHPHPWTGEEVNLLDYYTFSTASQWPENRSTLGSRITGRDAAWGRTAAELRDRYGAVAVNLEDGDGNVEPSMIATEWGPPEILSATRNMLANGFGWYTYYLPLDRYRYAGGRREFPKGTATLQLPERGHKFNWASGNTNEFNQPEAYFSIISQVLHGAPVVYNDPNAPALPAPFTGFGYGYWEDRNLQPWGMAARQLYPDVD